MKKTNYWYILILLAAVPFAPCYGMDEGDDDIASSLGPETETFQEYSPPIVISPAQIPANQHPIMNETALLRQRLDRFGDNINALLQEGQPAPESVHGAVKLIQQHHDALQHYCQELQILVNEKAREQELNGHSAAACNEIHALFDLTVKKVDNFNSKLEALIDTELPDQAHSPAHMLSIEKELAFQNTHIAGSRIVETLAKFFGLVSNDESAHYLCSGVNVTLCVSKKLLKKPLEIDRILRESHAKWYGGDVGEGLAARYDRSLNPILDTACQILQERYQAADALQQTISGLERNIKSLEFSIYELRRQKRHEDELAEATNKGELERQKSETHTQLRHLYNSPLGLAIHKTEYDPYITEQLAEKTEASNLKPYIKHFIKLAIKLNYLDDMYSQFVIASGRRRCLLADLASRLQVAQIAQPLALRLRQKARQFKTQGATDFARSCLRKARKIVEAKNTSASVGRSTSSSNRPCPFTNTVCHWLGSGIHTGFVRGYQNASVPERAIEGLGGIAGGIGDVPRLYEKVGRILEVSESTWYLRHPRQAIGKAASNWWSGNGGYGDDEENVDEDREANATQTSKDGADKRKQNKVWLSEKMRKTAFNFGKAGRPLNEFANNIRSTTEKVTGFLAENKPDILRIHALALLLDTYSSTDPRTRNLGEGRFRLLFDRLGDAFDHPEQVLRLTAPASPMILDEASAGPNASSPNPGLPHSEVADFNGLRHRRSYSRADQ